MSRVFGQQVAAKTLMARSGAADQLFGIRSFRFEDGPAAGSRLIEMRNHAGLTVNLLPDRMLDLGQVWLNGFPFAWMGPGGLAPKSADLGLEELLGGLMCTCGFDHIRQPLQINAVHYPLHGSSCLRPVDRVEISDANDPGAKHLRVSAWLSFTDLDGAKTEFFRQITLPLDRNEIEVRDRITKSRRGGTSPVVALYHVNLGYPLIGEDTKISVDAKGRPDLFEQPFTTRVETAPTAPYRVQVSTPWGARHIGLTCEIEAAQLPFLQFHKRPQDGQALFCIEPCTHDREWRETLDREANPKETVTQEVVMQLGFDCQGNP